MAKKWWKKRSAEADAEDRANEQFDAQSSSDDELKPQFTAPTASSKRSRWLFFRRRRPAGHAKVAAQTGDMKKFGLGKKSQGDKDDRSGTSLFGRKKPAAQDDNPYAQQPAEDPYARKTPYQQARADLAAGPQAPRPGAAGLPSGPRPGAGGLPSGPGAQRNGYGTPPPAYQGSPQVGGGGYAPEKFGAAGGYGSNLYDAGASTYGAPPASQSSARFASRGPGGYGGLGPAEEASNRDELLGGARQRPAAPPSYVSADNNAADPSGATGGYDDGYGEQRELTEEEIEKQDYIGIKNQIKDVRQQTVNSSTNAVMLMENAINLGRGTLVRLGQQGDMLSATDKNLNLALNQARVAGEKTSELKTLNRSMFIPHVKNPFTSDARQAKRDQQVIEQHRIEAEQRDATRKAAFAGNQDMEKTFRELGRGDRPTDRSTLLGQSRSTAERRKYMIEEDSDEEGAAEDRRAEELLESNMRSLEIGVPILNKVAKATAKEVGRQNVGLNTMDGKITDVDVGIAVTRAKLAGIH